MSDSMQQLILAAQQEAHRLGFPFIQREQLFLGLLHDQQVARIFTHLGVDLGTTRREVEARLMPGLGAPHDPSEIGILPTAEQVMQQRAQTAAAMLGHDERRPEHVLVGFLLEQHGTVLEVLAAQGVTKERVLQAIADLST